MAGGPSGSFGGAADVDFGPPRSTYWCGPEEAAPLLKGDPMTRRRIFTLAAVSGGEVLAVALVAYLLAAR